MLAYVYNFLPSISAVTGVSPQRYLWRVAVALHISPRLLVAFVSKSHYESLGAIVSPAKRPAYQSLVNTAFYLNLVELATLCGVTYISNKENYPVHEKFFTLFMMVSLVYMLVVVRVFSCVETGLSPAMKRSFLHKKCIFGLKLAATAGLMFFFYRHRVYCLPKAFSWFSLCEYVIATCNMLYHVSVALDFSEHDLIVGQIVYSPPTQNATGITSSAVDTSIIKGDAGLNPDVKIEPSTETSSQSGSLVSQSSSNAKVNELNINPSDLMEDKLRQEKESVSNDISGSSLRKRGVSNVDEADGKLKNVETSAYFRLNSSSESVSKLHDHESPTASSEFLPSSSVTSSLSRSTSGFSAGSSSVGVSESVSLEAIYSRNRQESSDTMNDRLLDEEGDSQTGFQVNNKVGLEDLKIDGVTAPLCGHLDDKSGVEGDTESICTNPLSLPARVSHSGSSDLSDEANSSLTLRQTRNEMQPPEKSCIRDTEPVGNLNSFHSSPSPSLPLSSCTSSHSDNPIISSQVACTISTVNSVASPPVLSCSDAFSSSQLHQRFRNLSSENEISSSSIAKDDDSGRLLSAPASAQSSVKQLPNVETDPTSRVPSFSGVAVDEKTSKAHKE
ncbi:Frag1/DRAM/Sfk1 [Trinorchestia longiramus]|nr:Frag1/DRAM/Sfk1 [Trinorchestia longiramus]